MSTRVDHEVNDDESDTSVSERLACFTPFTCKGLFLPYLVPNAAEISSLRMLVWSAADCSSALFGDCDAYEISTSIAIVQIAPLSHGRRFAARRGAGRWLRITTCSRERTTVTHTTRLEAMSALAFTPAAAIRAPRAGLRLRAAKRYVSLRRRVGLLCQIVHFL